MKMNKNYF